MSKTIIVYDVLGKMIICINYWVFYTDGSWCVKINGFFIYTKMIRMKNSKGWNYEWVPERSVGTLTSGFIL